MEERVDAVDNSGHWTHEGSRKLVSCYETLVLHNREMIVYGNQWVVIGPQLWDTRRNRNVNQCQMVRRINKIRFWAITCRGPPESHDYVQHFLDIVNRLPPEATLRFRTARQRAQQQRQQQEAVEDGLIVEGEEPNQEEALQGENVVGQENNVVVPEQENVEVVENNDVVAQQQQHVIVEDPDHEDDRELAAFVFAILNFDAALAAQQRMDEELKEATDAVVAAQSARHVEGGEEGGGI